MAIQHLLETRYPRHVWEPATVHDLPHRSYMVYLLTYRDTALVVDWGRRERARVIFDDQDHSTAGHRNALQVRACRLFGQDLFRRFILSCDDAREAKAREKSLQQEIGGDRVALPADISTALFKDIPAESPAHLVLQLAMCSSHDGLTDLKRWRRAQLLPDEVWRLIGERLRLEDSLRAT